MRGSYCDLSVLCLINDYFEDGNVNPMTNIPPFEDYNPIQISESVKNLKLENYIEGDIIFDGRGNVISYNICRITPKGEKYLKKVLLGGTPTYGTLSGSILEK